MTPLYRRVLGDRFDALPREVKALHNLTGTSMWKGTADVERGSNPLSRLAGWMSGLPPAGPGQALTVTFEPREGREIWTRAFGTAIFRTVQFEDNGVLHERAGPATFRFALRATEGALSLRLIAMRVFGIPVPPFLLPRVATEEREVAGRYRFRVESSLPIAGFLVRYAGSLTRVDSPPSA